ncbi:hypothetical protein [Streptomyces lincolnensis]|uniref:hypothetical protein n=1 Tax=Streptomyces lincolnensis TaxID=1915 RepID=UPI0037D3E19A
MGREHPDHALPLRINHETVGAVNLLLTSPGGLTPTDLELGQALSAAEIALAHGGRRSRRRFSIRSSGGVRSVGGTPARTR